MKFTDVCHKIFTSSIDEYHKYDDVDYKFSNPYPSGSLESLLFMKNWIDTVQWHLEDIIRDPNIDPVEALKLKRRIDSSNQERTDMVEYIDSYFLDKYKDVKINSDAKINTESPAWAIDRLSILYLKLYHMQCEVKRDDVSKEHKDQCLVKYNILSNQLTDLTTAIEELILDISNGVKYMKVYKQMKMYNDPSLNPILYAKK